MIGNINSIETMGLVDGPGVRLVVFMQGCPMRCIFCHNPETWDTKEHLLMSPSEIVALALKYKSYFKNNGGITFSGGEPLIQPAFLLETLKLCKENNINTCLDTSGVGLGDYDEILKYTDLVIYDIKAISKYDYHNITKGNIATTQKFLESCALNNTRLWIRQVIIPGINDNREYILKLKAYIKKIKHVDKIELLPYHKLGIGKYDKMGIEYPLRETKNMSKTRIKELSKILNSKEDI